MPMAALMLPAMPEKMIFFRAVAAAQHLDGSGGVGLAHAGAADDNLLAGQRAAVVGHPGVFLLCDAAELLAQQVDFRGHCAHDPDNHCGLLTR